VQLCWLVATIYKGAQQSRDRCKPNGWGVRTVFCCLAGAAAALSADPSAPSFAAFSSGLLQVRQTRSISISDPTDCACV
jgi:hypothetical protein